MINRRHILHRFKLRQNAPLGNLFIKFFQHYKLPKHHFKLQKNAQLSDLVSKKFLAVPTFKTLFHVAADCTIKQPRFKMFLSSSNF